MSESRIVKPFEPFKDKKPGKASLEHLVLMATATQAFLCLGFFGRMKWLLFGASAFRPKGAPKGMES